MKFKTSTSIAASDLARQEGNLRSAAIDTGNDKFFRDGEHIEVEYDATAASIEELAAKGRQMAMPMGNPTLCAIAYQAALQLCGGNALCEAIAYEAYQACLRS